MQSNFVKLKIFGSEYPIKAATDVEYIRRVADFVDHRMYQVEENSTAKSASKIAVLTALNIADELFREREARRNQIVEYEKKLTELSELIDNAESIRNT